MPRTSIICTGCAQSFATERLWSRHKSRIRTCEEADFKTFRTRTQQPDAQQSATPADPENYNDNTLILATVEGSLEYSRGPAPPLRTENVVGDTANRTYNTILPTDKTRYMYCSTMPEHMRFHILTPPTFHLGSVGSAPIAPVEPTTDREIVMIPVGRIIDAARPYKRGKQWIERAGSIAFARLEVDDDVGARYQFVDITGTYLASEHIWFNQDYLTSSGKLDLDRLDAKVSIGLKTDGEWFKANMKTYIDQKVIYDQALRIYQAIITANMAWTGDGVWKLADGPDRVLQLGGISSNDKELSPDAFNKIVAKLVGLAKAHPPGTRRRRKRNLIAALAFTGTPDNGSAV